MVITNEPGFYKAGSFGIRIENILLVNKKTTDFLNFNCLTLIPYCRQLIMTDLLCNHHKTLIQDYNNVIMSTIMPILQSQQDNSAIEYLNDQLNIKF